VIVGRHPCGTAVAIPFINGVLILLEWALVHAKPASGLHDRSSAHPRKLSVEEVARLAADPVAVYASGGLAVLFNPDEKTPNY
jgi:hypothetical protein